MPMLDDVNKIIEEFPSKTATPKELAELSEFFDRMKKAGIAKAPVYNLPQPDTIGRTLVETCCAIPGRQLDTK